MVWICSWLELMHASSILLESYSDTRGLWITRRCGCVKTRFGIICVTHSGKDAALSWYLLSYTAAVSLW